MTNEDILDSIGSIEDSYIDEVDSLRRAQKSGRGKTLLRKIMIPLAACLSLILVGFTAHHLLFSGNVLLFSGSTVGDGKLTDAKVYFDPDKTLIDMDEINGTVTGVSDIIVERFKTMEWDESSEIKPAGSYPGSYSTMQYSAEEIKAFIGCSRLKMAPLLLNGLISKNGIMANINVFGEKNGNIENIIIGIDSRINDMNVQTFTTIFTENQKIAEDGTIGMWLMSGQNDHYELSDLEKEMKVVNNREFMIIKNDSKSYIDPSYYPDGYKITDSGVSKNIFWQEDKVIYNLHIFYPEDREADAEEIITEWMNAF